MGPGPFGERGEKTHMEHEVRPVEDREEWSRIAEAADGPVITLKGFQVQDTTVDRPVGKKKTVEKLARALGWELARGLAVVTPLNLVRAGGVSQRVGGGGWWIGVPVDFLEGDPSGGRLEWAVAHKGHEHVLWCIQEFMRRTQPGRMPADFRYSVEMCIKDGALYSFHDHPDAPRMVEEAGRIAREHPDTTDELLGDEQEEGPGS